MDFANHALKRIYLLVNDYPKIKEKYLQVKSRKDIKFLKSIFCKIKKEGCHTPGMQLLQRVEINNCFIFSKDQKRIVHIKSAFTFFFTRKSISYPLEHFVQHNDRFKK